MRSLDRDGVALCFEHIQGSRTTLVFLHGWCCDHTHFAPQLSYFASRGYDVLALDLRGHGASGKPRDNYTMGLFADDVAFLCDEFDIESAVFIGHSMGGIVAYELARRRPDLAEGIVMIDSAVALPAAARMAIDPFLEKLAGPDYAEALSAFVTNVLALPSDDRSELAKIIAGMTAAPRHVMIPAFEGLRDYDPGASTLDAPALYIAGDEPHARCDMAKLHELIPGLAYGQTVGAGHFCQLEVPDQVNAMIARFLVLLR